MKPTLTIRLSRKNEITTCAVFLIVYGIVATITAATMKPTLTNVITVLFTFAVIFVAALSHQGFEIIKT